MDEAAAEVLKLLKDNFERRARADHPEATEERIKLWTDLIAYFLSGTPLPEGLVRLMEGKKEWGQQRRSEVACAIRDLIAPGQPLADFQFERTNFDQALAEAAERAKQTALNKLGANRRFVGQRRKR